MITRIVLASAVWAFATGGTEQAKLDLKRMQGTWTARILETGGKALSAEDQTKFRIKLIIRDNAYTVFFDDKQITTGTMKLDPSKKPATIDAVPSDGPHKGKIQPGIYKFEGNDMKVVFSEPGQARPTEFKSRPNTQEAMLYYQRAGK